VELFASSSRVPVSSGSSLAETLSGCKGQPSEAAGIMGRSVPGIVMWKELAFD
jgi:hypothetical protein